MFLKRRTFKFYVFRLMMVGPPKKTGSHTRRRKDCPLKKAEETWIVLEFGRTMSAIQDRREQEALQGGPQEDPPPEGI